MAICAKEKDWKYKMAYPKYSCGYQKKCLVSGEDTFSHKQF